MTLDTNTFADVSPEDLAVTNNSLTAAINDIDNRLSNISLEPDPYGEYDLLDIARALKQIIDLFGGSEIC